MSAVKPPAYITNLDLERTPTYSAEPQGHERRIALVDRLRALPTGNFIKESKGRGVILRLNAQRDNIELPVYGLGGQVEGTVELPKTETVESVEVKIEGRLLLKELGEGGSSSVDLCLDSAMLWTKETEDDSCPPSLKFSLALPDTFPYEGTTYPLPPSFHVKLSGLPGFIGTIEYSVSVVVAKPHSTPIANVKVKANTLGMHIGTTIVNTPFIYYPRSRPSSAMPLPLQYWHSGFKPTSEWKMFEYTLQSKSISHPSITAKFYIPAHRTFCIADPIPFHLTIQSTASVSLSAFLPFSPTSTSLSSRRITRVQLIRQATVDVGSHELVTRARTEMWRTDCIGEATFKHAGDGDTWMSYNGELVVDENVIPGFRAAGLHVKDCILFSITPHDISKSPFHELREPIHIRLTSDPWSGNAARSSGRRESVLESGTPPDDS